MSANPIPSAGELLPGIPHCLAATQYEFRYTHTSRYLLEKWGFELAPGKTIPAMAWAAAMAGFVDSAGKYRSAGFKNETEFMDEISLDDDLNPLYQAVTDALGKVLPKAKLELVPSSGEKTPREHIRTARELREDGWLEQVALCDEPRSTVWG